MSATIRETGAGDGAPGEVWWLVHVDISPRDALIRAESLLQGLVADHDVDSFGAAPVVMRQRARSNHFEIVWTRPRSPYEEYRRSTPMVELRHGLAPFLASPFVVRSCESETATGWSGSSTDEVIVLSEFEIVADDRRNRPPAFADYVATQQAAAGQRGFVVLERRGPAGVVELISRWSDEESFERFVADPTTQRLRAGLNPSLAAPIEDRQHHIVVGEWASG